MYCPRTAQQRYLCVEIFDALRASIQSLTNRRIGGILRILPPRDVGLRGGVKLGQRHFLDWNQKISRTALAAAP